MAMSENEKNILERGVARGREVKKRKRGEKKTDGLRGSVV